MMKTSERGKALLIELEGMELREYLDTGGAPTIGVGHLLTKSERTSGKIFINGSPVRYADGLTKQQCLDLLSFDLGAAETAVNNHVRQPLLQHQFDALVSFTFNVGSRALLTSALLKELNAGRFDQVPTQMRRWVFDNGARVQGLVNRREKEIARWQARPDGSAS